MKTPDFLAKYQEFFTTTEKQVKKLIVSRLKQCGYKPQNAEKFVYAKGDKEKHAMLIAHYDTAHYSAPANIFKDAEHGVIWSPEGLGADDRAGVVAILELLERGYRPTVLFTDEEERGGGGAFAAAEALDEKLSHVDYLLQIDRRNGQEYVLYNAVEKSFKKFIESFGWVKASGTFSDIATLSPYWGIAAATVSAGYYQEHGKGEYLVFPDWLESVERIAQMLKTPRQGRWIGWDHFKVPMSQPKNKSNVRIPKGGYTPHYTYGAGANIAAGNHKGFGTYSNDWTQFDADEVLTYREYAYNDPLEAYVGLIELADYCHHYYGLMLDSKDIELSLTLADRDSIEEAGRAAMISAFFKQLGLI